MDTGYLLMSVAKKLKHQLNRKLIADGITAQQWAVLQNIALLAKKGPVTAVALSHTIGIDKPTISGIIKRLVDKQLVEKIAAPSDKRAFHLKVTKLGYQQLAGYHAISDQVLTDYLTPLTEHEKRDLNKLLSKLDRNGE